MTQADRDSLVEVFRTADPALLPLALATLEQASIEFAVHSANEGNLIMYGPRVGLGDVEGTAVIVVRSADAARAADLLSALGPGDESGTGVHAESEPPALEVTSAVPFRRRAPAGPANVQLIDQASGALLGRVTDDQLQFLIDQLEEESDEDRDYYIDAATIDLLESRGGDAALIELLRRALGSRAGMDVEWRRQ